MKYAIIPTCLVLALAAGCGNKTGDAGKKEGGDVAVVNGKAISRSTFDFYVQGVTGKPATEAEINQWPGVITVGIFARHKASVCLLSTSAGVKTLTF